MMCDGFLLTREFPSCSRCEYLEAQLEEARSDVGGAAVELVTDPGRYEEISAVAAVESTTELFDSAQVALAEAGEAVPQLIDDARETLDDAADAAARTALWAFAGLVVGAAIASFAALWGSRLVASRTETGRLRVDRTIDRPESSTPL